MDPLEIQGLERQNAYLKQRCAQLEGDVSDLGAQVTRLTEQLERLTAGRAARSAAAPNPLSGGQ
jgi:outer membrane murein-binding lipoprotein Lpp